MFTGARSKTKLAMTVGSAMLLALALGGCANTPTAIGNAEAPVATGSPANQTTAAEPSSAQNTTPTSATPTSAALPGIPYAFDYTDNRNGFSYHITGSLPETLTFSSKPLPHAPNDPAQAEIDLAPAQSGDPGPYYRQVTLQNTTPNPDGQVVPADGVQLTAYALYPSDSVVCQMDMKFLSSPINGVSGYLSNLYNAAKANYCAVAYFGGYDNYYNIPAGQSVEWGWWLKGPDYTITVSTDQAAAIVEALSQPAGWDVIANDLGGDSLNVTWPAWVSPGVDLKQA